MGVRREVGGLGEVTAAFRLGSGGGGLSREVGFGDFLDSRDFWIC